MARILIVEDELPMAKALALKFTEIEYETVIALNGKEALSVLDNEEIDLIILDIVMPTMNGIAFLRELVKQNVAIPVIVASNLSHEDDITEARRLGAKDYFIKADTTLNDIVAKVKNIIEEES